MACWRLKNDKAGQSPNTYRPCFRKGPCWNLLEWMNGEKERGAGASTSRASLDEAHDVCGKLFASLLLQKMSGAFDHDLGLVLR